MLIQHVADSGEWPRHLALLKPALDVSGMDADEMLDRLGTGQDLMFKVEHGDSYGALVAEVCELDGRIVFWASFIAGNVSGGPRKWLTTMREIMAAVEKLAKDAGCHEVRIGGRDRARVFPGYERFDDKPNRLRKVL